MAGWMTAMRLVDALGAHDIEIEIEVLDSPTVETIGMGEGSTPWLRGFFDSLGIAESDWTPACNATCKCSITFAGWSTKPGFESYFPPFAPMLDNLALTASRSACRRASSSRRRPLRCSSSSAT